MAASILARWVTISALLLVQVHSFTSPLLPHYRAQTRQKGSLALKIRLQDDTTLRDSIRPHSGETAVTRRDLLSTTFTASILAVATSTTSAAPASAVATNNQSICVIGANGKTGTACVQACLERSIPVTATSRSGIYNADDSIASKVCDVTQPDTIARAVAKQSAVIFAASASKQGGTPALVDNQGLVNVATACLAAGTAHLVIVSSGGVSKPDSPVYKFLNIFGGIMEQKIQGEDAVRELYKNNRDGLTYTIIRPGGLTIEEPVGVSGLELNQGDTKSGRISRADVAALCVEAIRYPDLTGAATFECYNADTAKPLQSVGMSNILKQTSSDPSVLTGKERRGRNWKDIFTGLEKDCS